MRFGLAKPLRLAALLTIFLAAETAAIAHGDLDQAHPSSECALCVGLATFSAGDVATPQHVAVIVDTAASPDYLFRHAVSRRTALPVARGPPQAS